MSTELTNMETATPFDKLKLAIVGKEKAGKSRLAVTGRKPVLLLDFDQRKESVAGTPGLFAATIADPGASFMQPTALSETLDLLSKLEKEATLSDLGFTNTNPVTNSVQVLNDYLKMRPQTLIVDSCQTFAKTAMRYALFSSKEIRREINVGGKMQVFVPKGFDAWNGEMDMVEQALLRMLALPMDVIWTFHESPEEAPDSTSESPKFTGRVDVFPARYKRLIKWFNEVWRVEREGVPVPTVLTSPSYQFTAATCLNIDGRELPNIETMVQKHITKTGQTSKLLMEAKK